MTPALWRKVEEIFHSAMARPHHDRARYLDDVCGSDADVRREVARLIDRAEESGGLLTGGFSEIAASLVSDEEEFEPGQFLGAYRIVRKAGSGGMGHVYEAEDTRLGRRVAIKRLALGHRWNPEMAVRFQREARLTSGLSHPNVVTLFDVGELEGTVYLVTEFIEGETLRSRLNRAELTEDEVLSIAIQTAAALSAAHRLGIVHRDIKPENIMIRADGLVKVVDFGMAKAQAASAGADSGRSMATATGMMLGTLAYAAPEQLKGGAVGPPADLWSFGIVLFEMFERRRPFSGETPIHAAMAILDTPVPPMRNTPPAVATLIQQLLEKDPGQRPQSITEVRETLERAKAESARSTRRNAKHPWGWVVAAAIVVVAAIIATIVWNQKSSDVVPSSLLAQPRQLTDSGDVRLDAVSPDGRYVGYVRGSPGAQSLWVRRTDGSEDRQLSEESTGRYVGLTFSNDNRSIYCVQYKSGLDSDLLRYEVSGGQPVSIHSDVDSAVTFAPDGMRFAFVRTTPDSSLIIGNLSDSSEEVLLRRGAPEGISRAAPAWSPDGTRVLAVTYTTARASTYRMTLTAVNVQSHEARTVSSEFAFMGRPMWVAGGIVVAASRVQGNAQLFLISATNRSGAPLTRDPFKYVDGTVTADGRTLVTVRGSARSWISFAEPGEIPPKVERLHSLSDGDRREHFSGLRWFGKTQLVVPVDAADNVHLWTIAMPPNGGRRQLTSGEAKDLYASPCGTSAIVYVSRRASDWDIWRLDPKSQATTRITEGVVNPTFPQCTPDGKAVLYQAMSQGARTLWSVSVPGGTPRQLTQHISQFPAMSRDGATFVAQYATERAGGNWIVGLFSMQGGNPKRVFEGIDPNSPLRWHPTKPAFTWMKTHERVTEFWTQPVDGGSPKKEFAVAEPGQVVDFDWSPDGHVLAYLTNVPDSDAVAFRLR